MTSRNIRDRLGAILNPPEITSPAEELAESREVAPGGEVSGHLLAHHLEFPEELGPDWTPLLTEMREGLSEAVGAAVAELIAQTRPEPLTVFRQATANADGVATVRLAPVPLAAMWEITNLYILHAEATAADVTVRLEPGGQIDALSVPADVGGGPDWSGPLYMRESVRLEVEAAALTAGSNLDVAIIGLIHSTRRPLSS